MITVVIGGVKVACFKAFLGWGLFVATLLGTYSTTPPATPSQATIPVGVYLPCYTDAQGFSVCIPCRLIGGCTAANN